MTISLKANAAGTQGEILLNGTPVQTFNQNLQTFSGQVKSAVGGFVFPDGSVQDTAAPPAFRASTSNTSFPNNVATPVADFQTMFPTGTIPGWNPTTGEYTIQKAGWYSMSFWMSVGLNAALNFNPYFQRWSGSAWSSFAGSFFSSGSSAKTYISGVISGIQYFNAGDKLRVMGIVEWGDSGNHPLTDGTSQLNVSFLHP